MKKYQDNSINESVAEETLMDNLLNFYISKYGSKSVDEVEEHLVSALSALVDRGELKSQSVIEFLDDRGIERELVKPKPAKKHITLDEIGRRLAVVYRDRDVYSGGGCGYSGGRSSC